MGDFSEIRSKLKPPLITRRQGILLSIMTAFVVLILSFDVFVLFFGNDLQVKMIPPTGLVTTTSSPDRAPTHMQPSKSFPSPQAATRVLQTATAIPANLKYPTFTLLPSPTNFVVTPLPTHPVVPTP